MRLLFLSNLYPPVVRGGYEILCAQVAERLVEKGHQVTVLTTEAEGQPRLATRTGVEVDRRLRLEKPFGEPLVRSRPMRLLRTWANEDATHDVLRELRPDAVMVWSRLRLTTGPSRVAERAGVPTLYTFNDRHALGFRPARPGGGTPTLRSRIGRCLDSGPFRRIGDADHRFEHVMSISRALAAELREAGLPVSDADVRVQGIPLQRFPIKADAGEIHTPARLLVAGQLHPDKGFDTAIRAVHRLAMAGVEVHLTVAGGGCATTRAELDGLAASGVGRVDFVGRIAHDAMPALYRDHDIVLFPSRWSEPMGLVHLEAMASGTPVISTTTGGSSEVIRDRENALAFPTDDDRVLAARIAELIRTPTLAHRLAREARRYVQTHHDLDRWIDGIEARLDSISTTGHRRVA